MQFFRTDRSRDSVIRKAALCVLQDGRRHPHQRRIPKNVLEEAELRLQTAADGISEAPDFAALYDLVNRVIGPISGIGALTVYDIAHRLGAFLNKEPALVYLHAGTKAGAALLGFRGESVRPDELPPSFSRLTAAEIEDCLCRYCCDLQGKLRAGPSKRQPLPLCPNFSGRRKGCHAEDRRPM